MKKNRGSLTIDAPKREATRAHFVLGRKAFTRVSAVEGISPSSALVDDLKRLHDATPERRRSALADKYSKR